MSDFQTGVPDETHPEKKSIEAQIAQLMEIVKKVSIRTNPGRRGIFDDYGNIVVHFLSFPSLYLIYSRRKATRPCFYGHQMVT